MLTAVTLNGAAAIDMADKVGTVEAGKLGDPAAEKVTIIARKRMEIAS